MAMSRNPSAAIRHNYTAPRDKTHEGGIKTG